MPLTYTTIPTEQTTAVTDAILAVALAGGIYFLRRTTPPSPSRRVWLSALGSFALSAALGAVAHGVLLGPAQLDLIWQLLYLLLGITLAQFVLGTLAAWRGYATAQKSIPAALALAVLFYFSTRLGRGEFLVFVLFEAVTLICCALVYIHLALAGFRGAGWVAAGFLLSLAAGVVQTADTIQLQIFGWIFDHNSFFHLAQLVAAAVLMEGLRRTFFVGSSRQ